MTRQNSYSEYTIIGGGIAGLSTAIALKKNGINAMVFEAAADFKPVGAGLILAPNAIAAYDYIGISEKIITAGNPLGQLSILNQKGRDISTSNVKTIDPEATYLSIHRADLHKVLIEQMDESQVVLGCRSYNIETGPNGYTIKFENGRIHSTKYLIVAEGIHSKIRKIIFPDVKERYAGYACWRGVTDNSQMQIKRASETWGSKGRFGIVPLENNQIYWFAVVNTTQNNPIYSNYTQSQILEIFKDYHAPIGSIISNTPNDSIIWNDISDLVPTHQFAHENIVFVGDAIHATTPNLGQGACQAIEDAAILAKCIADEAIVKNAFKKFEEKRVPRTNFIVNQSWKIGKIAQNGNNLVASLRNGLLAIIPERVLIKQLKKVVEFKLD